jgi:hypothetical protein
MAKARKAGKRKIILNGILKLFEELRWSENLYFAI